MDYRHELKFLLPETELTLLYHMLLPLMRPDEHQKNGGYMIRSLYFDDLDDSCLQENESGVDQRQKFRIRIYDGNSDVIHLEKKEKLKGMTKKSKTNLTLDECKKYMAGPGLTYQETDTALKKELYLKGQMSGMKPSCIVEYYRTALVERCGNVRITFDKNIAGSSQCGAFLDKDIRTVPVLPKGVHILEVKYDEFLPDYIREILEMSPLQQTTFSKYYYVRQALLETYSI